ncbi:hypothetical protein E2C01_026049 [Portunus trituberculatus]|uniref:Uncharacterized protein n=1 Tax=Portunus trituberculatus TaxID=210409 RepID=A0A5B7EI41_PORTR|nr:hypothetical protein [Portunus trituberculatus]
MTLFSLFLLQPLSKRKYGRGVAGRGGATSRDGVRCDGTKRGEAGRGRGYCGSGGGGKEKVGEHHGGLSAMMLQRAHLGGLTCTRRPEGDFSMHQHSFAASPLAPGCGSAPPRKLAALHHYKR